ncbi:MAG: hypothetical protein ACXACA_08530 [Candidatus Ranarchaeia archaeon]|jgi:hypothetical protein
MLRKLFSSLRNENRHWLETSEVNKDRDEKTGLVRYVMRHSFFNKKVKRETIFLKYFTIYVESHVSLEEAKSRSMSFRSPLPSWFILEKEHNDYFKTVAEGRWVAILEMFPDGSYIGGSATKDLYEDYGSTRLRKLFSWLRNEIRYRSVTTEVQNGFDKEPSVLRYARKDQTNFNKDDWLNTTKVVKECDEKTGLFCYVQRVRHVNKKNERTRTQYSCWTIGVESHVSYEEAKSRSMSFKPYSPEAECVEEIHYHLENKKNGENSATWESKFSDGSCIVEIITTVSGEP